MTRERRGLFTPLSRSDGALPSSPHRRFRAATSCSTASWTTTDASAAGIALVASVALDADELLEQTTHAPDGGARTGRATGVWPAFRPTDGKPYLDDFPDELTRRSLSTKATSISPEAIPRTTPLGSKKTRTS
jgi:hypothetical protein